MRPNSVYALAVLRIEKGSRASGFLFDRLTIQPKVKRRAARPTARAGPGGFEHHPRWLEGGPQGAVPLPTAGRLAVIAVLKQCRIRANTSTLRVAFPQDYILERFGLPETCSMGFRAACKPPRDFVPESKARRKGLSHCAKSRQESQPIRNDGGLGHVYLAKASISSQTLPSPDWISASKKFTEQG